MERAGLKHMHPDNIEGYKRPTPVKYSDEDLLEEVRRVAELVAKPVRTMLDYETHGRTSRTTITNRLGKWQAALERAGIGHMVFTPAKAKPRTKSALQNVRR